MCETVNQIQKEVGTELLSFKFQLLLIILQLQYKI